ncbi:SprT-like domain-containing protein (plasmid) [Chryseobacterium sp. JJR-5R]|uniref:SprT-like domain-containing protein n=1 Tax=Chryseobacterium sp. JJR-5R TaxID=3093923 RepID=UPI002A749099|nr:SprT-like domain-containing protein [Chryseobacterium sp. JJR-5R]WPO84636.1 SprT-like domain-containing protein [Chryseobacterium sp. JJR-5R]
MKPTLEFYTLFQFIYDHFNHTLYNNELPSCMIVITRKNRTFGYYSSKRWVNKENIETDELAINPMFFSKYPLIEMLQTVVHEMCHLWQNHFGKESRRTYHNKEWGNKMVSIGLMPSNTGNPGCKKTGQQMMEYPFIETCKSLVKNPKFEKLWYDRTTNIKLLNFNFPEEQEEIIGTTSTEDQDNLRLLYSSFSIENPLAKVSNTDSKSKYHCSNCNINLWGKPDLYIICGVCEGEFEEN